MRLDRVRKDNVGLKKVKNFIWKNDKTCSVYGSKRTKRKLLQGRVYIRKNF